MPRRPLIALGTAGYPEKVARRLRAMNVAVWSVAGLVGFFGIVRLLVTGHWWLAAQNLGVAACFAALPLLHRFGPAVAPVCFILSSGAFIVWVTFLLGSDAGGWLFGLAVAALGMLFLGLERAVLAGLLAAAAAVLMIALWLLAPENAGLLSDAQLAWNFAANAVASAAMIFFVVLYAVRAMVRAEEVAEREHRRSEALLLNILPPGVAARLKGEAAEGAGEAAPVADAYEAASVLFADLAGFTARAAQTEPAELVRFLNRVFSALDALVERHGLEKIKTSGDAYMVVSGVPRVRDDHAAALADLALAMREALAGLVDAQGQAVAVRIGLASGPVVAGVVGTRRFFYDVWGDAVNVAARMEQTGEPGTIQVAPEMAALLADRFVLQDRGAVEVRGKGTMRTFVLVGRK
ncbi:MAG: adenylate/guanylate cyclase domain-containing protein [Reyranellaceae bacterium]